MAITPNVYAPQEFRAAINPESTIGTANLTTMQLVNVDTPIQRPAGTIDVRDVRSGLGNTLKKADVSVRDKGIGKEITIAGIADKTVLPILLSNAQTIAVSTAPASFDVPFNYSAPDIVHGAGGDATKTLTLALPSPEAGRTEIYVGCVVTSLELTMDDATDGGRMHFSATLFTKYAVTESQATPGSMAAYPSTFYFLCDMNTTRTIGANDMVINKFSYTVENPGVGLGSQGANCDPEQIMRGKPEIKTNMVIGVKYDANSSGFFDDHRAGTSVAIEFSNNATWASATGIGFKADDCFLDIPAFAEVESGQYIDLNIQATSDTSGDQIQVIA